MKYISDRSSYWGTYYLEYKVRLIIDILDIFIYRLHNIKNKLLTF